jgi:conjugative relaxase-like TrwC/TraI family protein
MLRVTPIYGSQRAIDYYAGLIRQEKQEHRWEENQRQGHGRIEDYYLPASDEGGTWWGQGTKALGVSGLGTREQLRALFAGRHPASGQQLGQAPKARSIRAFDLTFSAPKSVSVLATLLGGRVERDFVAAHDNAVHAVLKLVEQRSFTRAGRNGVIRLETTGLSVLAVRHRTSRLLDPQLHTHALVIARVQGPDGRWRALDATMLYKAQRMLGALYQAALRSELTRVYPRIAWDPVVKGQAEIAGTARMREAFSRRTEQMQTRYERLLGTWRERHPGREPTDKERCLLERQAAKESRPAKDRAREPAQIALECERRAAQLGLPDGQTLERSLLHGGRVLGRSALSEQELGRQAVLALVKEKAAWTREDVEREVAARMGHEVRRSAEPFVRSVEALATRTIETFCVDLAAGSAGGEVAQRSLDREPALQRYTTAPLLEVEQQIVRWFTEAAAQGGQVAPQARMQRAARELERALRAEGRAPLALDPEQHRAAALIAGTHPVSVLVGPAGAGKTTTVRLAAIALAQERRATIALAHSSGAAATLGKAAGIRHETIKMFLKEHERPEGVRRELSLRRGDTIVLDEAGTTLTQDYHRLLKLCRDRGYRLVLVGDPRQLTAVGAGGMMNHARELLPCVELRQPHRFRERWEAKASLSLRRAEPRVLDRYERHGRIAAGAEQQVHERMLADWWKAHRSGVSYCFSVPTRAQAAHLGARAQERLIAARELDSSKSFETTRGNTIYVGDRVQTRRVCRRESIVKGGPVRAGETWTVTAIDRDGGVTLKRTGSQKLRRVHPEYAKRHLALAYFSTVHSAQGKTVQRAGTLIDRYAGFRPLYVGMTRGRESNRAYVVTDGEQKARDVLERALLRDRADLGVLAVQRALSELERQRRSAQRELSGREAPVPRRSAQPRLPGRELEAVRHAERRERELPGRGLQPVRRAPARLREPPGLGIGR